MINSSKSIDSLNIKKNGIYIDATLGYAGHSSEILKKIKRGFLFAFDQDEEAITYSNEALSKIGNNYKIIYDNFVNMKTHIDKSVDGILFDLGVSSPQLDKSERGFSFHNDAPLDMRMDKNNKISAKDVVNTYSFDKLVDIFYIYGEEKHAKSIAKKIIEERSKKTIETTLELSEIIKSSVPISYRNASHPARRVFQAIRIEVNKELEILEKSLLDAFDLLKPGGRIVVITFHSLEDRIVKNTFKKLTEQDEIMKKLPTSVNTSKAIKVTNKPILPSEEELLKNNRSRSSKLRVIEKI